jgi:hypothetical protein
MTNMGPSAAVRRCIAPHVFAADIAVWGRALLPPVAPATPAHKDHEKDIEAEA